jgi:hypothetical protein
MRILVSRMRMHWHISLMNNMKLRISADDLRIDTVRREDVEAAWPKEPLKYEHP